MDHSNELYSFATNLQRQINELVKNCEQCDQICLAQYGVTASQGYTLLSLPQEGTLSMNELSDAMEMACSTMTRLVDPLVSKELVYRKPDDVDRRIVRVGLTAKGQELRNSLEKSLQDFFILVLSEIQEEQRPMILSAIEQVTKLIKKALKTYCMD